MKKIKLKFATEYGRRAFYDRSWCFVNVGPLCDKCACNPRRYENWDIHSAHMGFLFNNEQIEKAKRGECHKFVQAKDINVITTEEE